MKRGGPEPPSDLRPVVVVHLEPGWGYDDQKGHFESDEGLEIAALDHLPAGTEIVATVPDLAAKAASLRDPDEARLARSFQVILPEGVDADEVRSTLTAWDCVESAQAAPVVSLPAEGGSGAAGLAMRAFPTGDSEGGEEE